jgi:hypothetical protein
MRTACSGTDEYKRGRSDARLGKRKEPGPYASEYDQGFLDELECIIAERTAEMTQRFIPKPPDTKNQCGD